jgi:C1A family cysteine protease
MATDNSVTIGVGLIKSPIDNRDYKYGEKCTVLSVDAIPETLDYRNEMSFVRNQGSKATCVAFATSAMKEWQERDIIGKNRYMSPEFIYENRCNRDIEGMNLRDAMDILLKSGICSEATYPYNRNDVPSTTIIPQPVYDEATKFKIKSYARINTQEELKTALLHKGPCLVAFPCYNNAINFWKQETGDVSLGGHCVLIVGYDKNGYILRNSWAITWGDYGYTYYPYGDWGEHWEIWSSIDLPTDPNTLPKDLTKNKCCLIA